MKDSPRAMFVNVYDRQGAIQSSYTSSPEEKKRIPRMEVTAAADEKSIDELQRIASSNKATFKMNEQGYVEIFIGVDSDRYDNVTRNVNSILFAKA